MFIDPISDLLLRIKTGTKARKEEVVVHSSKLVEGILTILKNEGYIVDFKTKKLPNNKKETKVILKYKNNVSSISGLKQISKPGLRVYSKAEKLPKVLNGLGIAIISTSSGLMTDKAARAKSIGGEVIAFVW
ncbi:30S ribosomal protein S8 [Malacoplasma iowae]|uniref:Small ribosomal subunit protein uS8 n=1 Tax=Malacoplasma iowae 695 TaxID=1048830 RepID=A0A6P1LES4_MALIO|nr:30S ribosomal protein S8 [Malacoplasma iowae]VEU62078.1 30S ribosomal protein S8 [Mycoplasmopsis fermentans]EGZ31613.1 30S ribosomal protein S8 [Malacoplasma iowae 695]QHG89979.1 30S ribosomal protein S8 [Malacoplasma iowae 695]WPL36295.1 30S ribosomal protein S8 [Malacoplasma iowae]VEU70553.1 30S ribosomal protein S8 [Malacoplasma iowae]